MEVIGKEREQLTAAVGKVENRKRQQRRKTLLRRDVGTMDVRKFEEVSGGTDTSNQTPNGVVATGHRLLPRDEECLIVLLGNHVSFCNS